MKNPSHTDLWSSMIMIPGERLHCNTGILLSLSSDVDVKSAFVDKVIKMFWHALLLPLCQCSQLQMSQLPMSLFVAKGLG